MSRSRTPLLAAALLLGLAFPAAAQILESPGSRILIEGRSASFVDRAGDGRDAAWISIEGDRELREPRDPRCPERVRIQLASVRDQGGEGLTHSPIIELDCGKWLRLFDSYLYWDPDAERGGVRLAFYGPKRLLLRLAGEHYRAPPAPMAFAQLRIEIGDASWLGRFYTPVVNHASWAYFAPPSRVAARGERAFWDTLGGDPERAHRAFRSLGKAVRRNPEDGRSHFLLGMLHFYDGGQGEPRWDDPDEALVSAIGEAAASLARAEALLWDGERGDSRVPGFAAIAAYQDAFLSGDSAAMARHLAALDRAVAANPIFNNFSLFGAAALHAPDHPVYDRVIEVADDLINFGPSARCVFDQPEICGSAGYAPHGTAAALTVIGDLYLKRGDADTARFGFGLAESFARDTGWPYLPMLDARLAEFDTRLALFGNGDPADDPPLAGQTEAACVVCHAR